MINEDGTGLERVTHDSVFDSFPMFSPNGKKLIWTSDCWLDSLLVPEGWESFDLEHDPAETTNLWDALEHAAVLDEPAKAMRQMRTHLEAWRTLTNENSSRAALAPEVRDQLRSLGY